MRGNYLYTQCGKWVESESEASTNKISKRRNSLPQSSLVASWDSFPPADIFLNNCLEHTSCACVAFFTRFALTHAGSYSKEKHQKLPTWHTVWTVYKSNEGKKGITSGTKRETPNLMSRSTCSMTRIAASPGSIFHFPSWSYKHTRRAEFVHMDITIRNWNHNRFSNINAIIRLYRIPMN